MESLLRNAIICSSIETKKQPNNFNMCSLGHEELASTNHDI